MFITAATLIWAGSVYVDQSKGFFYSPVVVALLLVTKTGCFSAGIGAIVGAMFSVVLRRKSFVGRMTLYRRDRS